MMTKAHHDKRTCLAVNPLFSELAPRDLDQLAAITRCRHMKAGKVVFRQGDPGTEMYFIVSGLVQVSIVLPDDGETALRQLGSGEEFGEIALIDNKERTATVATLEPCEFLVITRNDFIAFLMDHPSVAIQLMAVMSRRLRAKNDLVKDTLHVNAKYRLAVTLQNLATGYGKNTQHGLRIDTTFSDAEIANITGIPREVVAGQLRSWCNAGFIEMQGGYITLVNPGELTRLRLSLAP